MPDSWPQLRRRLPFGGTSAESPSTALRRGTACKSRTRASRTCLCQTFASLKVVRIRHICQEIGALCVAESLRSEITSKPSRQLKLRRPAYACQLYTNTVSSVSFASWSLSGNSQCRVLARCDLRWRGGVRVIRNGWKAGRTASLLCYAPETCSQLCTCIRLSCLRRWSELTWASNRRHFFLSAAIGTFALCLSSVSAAPTLVTSKKLSARGSTCHGPDGKIWSAGDSFVCRGNTATRGAALRDFGDKDIGTIATSLTDWIFSRLNEKTGSVGKRGRKRRSLCRPTPANATVEVEVGKSVISLPYTAVADGRVTIDITAYLSASADNVTARAIDKRNGESVSVVTLVGGSATYFRDGGLDTCTLDYAILSTGTVPSGGNSTADAAATTDARLAKRGYWTLHTTYWADSGHDATDLNWNDIHNLALASYHSLPKGISEACGYMANSGSWHGAFRHWTGDNGSTLGECWFDREF
mgnify:FL=1|jgi:hypothetical protein